MSNYKYMSLVEVAVIYILTNGSTVILYAIHCKKPLDFRIFISTLLAVQLLGIIVMFHQLSKDITAIIEYKNTIAEQNEKDQSERAQTNTKWKYFISLGVALFIFQFISVVGDTTLSLLYFNTQQINTNQYITGILVFCALGCFIPIMFEYIGIKKGELSKEFTTLLTKKINALSAEQLQLA